MKSIHFIANKSQKEYYISFCWYFICTFAKTKFIVNMASKNLNRIKVVLADKQRTNKWLAEQLGKDKTTISKWCTNSSQPDLESLMKTAKLLNVEVTELLRTNVE